VLVASIAGLCLLPAASAFAEGSVNVNVGLAGENRHGLAYTAAPGVYGEDQYTVLRVFAQAGEAIQMGSSAMGLGGSSNIRVFPPGTSFASTANPAITAPLLTDPVFATAVLNCTSHQPGTGRIASRAQELAGPLPSTGGYTPCTYVAPTSGTYPIVMTPQSLTANNNVGTVAAPVVTAAAGRNIAAWDVTVRNAGATVQPGRAFSNALLLRTVFAPATATQFRANVYACTGYAYSVSFFNHRGGNWTLASDDHGVIDAATGRSNFASFNYGQAPAIGPVFLNAKAPLLTVPDVVDDLRHPVFFNTPDPLTITGAGGLQAERGCSPTPITPAVAAPTNVAFTGSGGQAGATNRGSGGTISFDSLPLLDGNDYSVELDLNANGSYADPADVTADGLQLDSSGNTFSWDGLDGTGVAPACGTYPYRIQDSLVGVHLTQDDVEDSGGMQIQRLTLPGDPAFPDSLAATYDDVDPYKGVAVTNTNPSARTNGSSGPGFHQWSGSSGNLDWVDTWTTLPGGTAAAALTVLCADVAITKSASPSPAVPGAPLTYQLVVTNNGPEAAADVQVSDPLPAGLTFVSASSGCGAAGQSVTCSLGTMSPGASQTLTVTADIASAVGGQVVNTAAVTSTTLDPDPANNTATATVDVPLEGDADLSIDKTPSTSTVGPGSQVLYTLVVTNDGPSDATGVTVSDAPPAGIVLQSAQASQGSCTVAPGALSCSLGGLVDDGTAQILVTAQVGDGATGALTNTARVTGDQRDPNGSNDTDPETVTVPEPPPGPQPRADLTIVKRGDRTAQIGKALTYRIEVRNDGPAAATGVRVTDTMSAPARLVSLRTTAGSCREALPLTCSLGTIQPGGRVTITVVIRPQMLGTLRNAASVTGEGFDPMTSNNLAVVATRVKRALTLTKRANRRTVRAGRTVTYTIRVRNPSDVAVRDVRTCDSLPSGLAFVRATPRARLTDGRYCWTTKRLGAGTRKTYQLTARALNGASGSTVNRATATSPDANTRRAKRAVRVRGGAAPGGGGVTG
jgi:uncharacterized repeat protein (TIGR01451 family)